MQFAAIMTASIQNTPESAKQRIGRDSPYWTQAYADVCVAIDREMALRAQLSATESKPIAWIVTTPQGTILHAALVDGWKVDVVQSAPNDKSGAA